MKKTTRKFGRSLSLERLEQRLLLAAVSVNPGELAYLENGDQLYFYQGAGSAPGGVNTNVVVATFQGPGSAQFTDYFGHSFLNNGSKIGDIIFDEALSDGSHVGPTTRLTLQEGTFRQGFVPADIPAALTDTPGAYLGGGSTPDFSVNRTITVPTGQIDGGTPALHNSGLGIAAANGWFMPDMYLFTAMEGEQITVETWEANATDADGLPVPGPQMEIYYRYSGTTATPTLLNPFGETSVTLGNFNGDTAFDGIDVFVFIEGGSGQSIGGNPYTLLAQRRVIDNFTIDATTQTTTDEDYPSGVLGNPAAPVLDITFEPSTPEFYLSGEGLSPLGGSDVFQLTVEHLNVLSARDFSPEVQSVRLYNASGGFLTDLMMNPNGYAPGATAQTIFMEVNNTGDWSFALKNTTPDMESIVVLPVDIDGNYTWFGGNPTSPGNIEVTGDIHFADPDATGFGTYMQDGPLLGSFGYAGTTGDPLDPAETLGVGTFVHEVLVGQLSGGVYLGGSLMRLRSHTTISGARQDEVGIRVGGVLMDVQAAGAITTGIEVLGLAGPGGFSDFIFSNDASWIREETFPVFNSLGRTADAQDMAHIVGSPTGAFTINGSLSSTDPFDWYVFTPGLGQDVTVDVSVTTSSTPAWVFSPNGQIVAVVDPVNPPLTFTADQGGNYYIRVGEESIANRWTASTVTTNYSIDVSGARPVHLGGVLAGSNSMANSQPLSVLATGATEVRLGYQYVPPAVPPGDGTIEFVNVANGGFLASANAEVGDLRVLASGDLGYVAGEAITNAPPYSQPVPPFNWDGSYGQYIVDGNFDKLEARTNDITLGYTDPDTFLRMPGLIVGGTMGEIWCPGQFGDGYYSMDVSAGSFGSIYVGGSFFADLAVAGGGLDLLWIDGDFGATNYGSTLSSTSGSNLGFVYVTGGIYDEGDLLSSVNLVGASGVFVDDGGGRITIAPVLTNPTPALDANGNVIPPEVQYRYIPVSQPGVGGSGAIITEIVATDSVSISAQSGSTDIAVVRFGDNAESAFTIGGGGQFAKVDVFYTETAQAAVARITNNSYKGDIVSVSAGDVNAITANGHVGASSRTVWWGGRLFNPMAAFGPAVLDGLTEIDNARFNGLVVGTVRRLEAGGSIGDVYSSGALLNVTADANNTVDGLPLAYRGHGIPARTWDGITGVVFASGWTDTTVDPPRTYGIQNIDPGSGIFGGYGEVPAGGVFTNEHIQNFSACNSVIAGPIGAVNGIMNFNGTDVALMDTTIMSGMVGEYTDWALWDSLRLWSTGVGIGKLTIKGDGPTIDGVPYPSGAFGVLFETGSIGQMMFGPRTEGMVDCRIASWGDSTTEVGLGKLIIRGGGLDMSGVLMYGWGSEINTTERIGQIILKGDGVNLIEPDIRSTKSIDKISVQDSVIGDTFMRIVAPFWLNTFQVGNVATAGSLNIASAATSKFQVKETLSASAGVFIDGRVDNAKIGEDMRGDFTVTGPNGSMGSFQVKDLMVGNLAVGSFLGNLKVGDDMIGQVMAGGADNSGFAVGNVKIGGNLDGITVVPVPGADLPGGGIKNVKVGGDVGLAGIVTSSYFDNNKGLGVPADIRKVKIGGNLLGDVVIQKTFTSGPFAPLDPGGNLGKLQVDGTGGVAVAGDIMVAGGAKVVQVKNGDFAGLLSLEDDLNKGDFRGNLAGAGVDVGGSANNLKVGGNVLNSFVDVGEELKKVDIKGDFTDSDIEAEALKRVKIGGAVLSTVGTREIHAEDPDSPFKLTIASLTYDIIDAIGQTINGVHAYIG